MRSHLIPFLIQATLAFSGLALIPHSAFAQEQSEAGRDQINLVWVSGYQGPLSGRMGPRAREAVVRFQDALGTTRTGVLTEYERDELENQAVAEKRRLGWQMRLDPATGMRIGIPETFLSGVTRKDSGTEYKGVRGSFLLQTMVKELSVAAGMREHMELVLDALRAQGFASTYMTLKDDWFVVNASHTSKRTDVYVRVHLVGRWVKGYLLFTPQNGAPIGAMVPAVSLSLQPDADEPLYRPPAPPSVVERYPTPMPAAVAPAAVKPTDPPVVVPPSKSGTGSGFIVAAGKILTNNHVVDGCTSVSVANVGGATVLALDVKNDLALIGAPSVSGPPLAIRGGRRCDGLSAWFAAGQSPKHHTGHRQLDGRSEGRLDKPADRGPCPTGQLRWAVARPGRPRARCRGLQVESTGPRRRGHHASGTGELRHQGRGGKGIPQGERCRSCRNDLSG
jgi:hypothetical protein